MIVGAVNVQQEAIVRLEVVGLPGRSLEIDGVIDTGYSGSLTLPPDVIAMLALPYRTSGRAVLADGTECVFDIYHATVMWDGRPRSVLVDSAQTDPLIGMDLLVGHELIVHVVEGGHVRIEALP